MKHILILVAVLLLQQAHAARITAEEYEKLDNFASECRNETGVDKEFLAKLDLVNGQDKLLAENGKYNKYLVCFSTKAKLVNADGVVQKDTLKKIVSQDITDAAIVDKIVDKCAVQKDTAAETASEMLKCVGHELEVYKISVHF